MKELWLAWFDNQTSTDRRTMAIAAIEHLLAMGDVRFRVDDILDKFGNPLPEEYIVEECLYWNDSGEDMRIPF